MTLTMTKKIYLPIAALIILLSSCLKQSIPDAMLNKPDKKAIPATMSYEINGNPVTISVKDARSQPIGNRQLYCEKSNGYVLSGMSSLGEFVFVFYTDSLQVDNYHYPSGFGPMYITTFEGRPQYIYNPGDNMNVNIISHKDGFISGNFSGKLTPMILAGNPNNIYGTPGSVVIKNGTFNNVPVYY